MRVLVTGGCGFLGSHLCSYYVKKGDKVVAFDNMTKAELMRAGYIAEEARMYNWNLLKDLGVELVKGDVRDYDQLLGAAKGADYIIHTAAQPAMTISWEDPDLDFTTNVLGTFNVLKAARQYQVPVASCATIHIYGGDKINSELTEDKTRYLRTPEAISENQPTLQGTLTPLHASKMAGDIYVRTFIDTYGLTAASFRLTGMYGPNQFGGEDHGWVGNFAIRAVLGKEINIFGSGKQVRDIIYASDVVAAFDAFYQTRKSGIYNIGGGKMTAFSLLECVDLLKEILGKDIKVNFGPDRQGDLRYFVCDIAKAKKELNWQPQVMPKEGVSKLVEWIKNNIQLFRL